MKKHFEFRLGFKNNECSRLDIYSLNFAAYLDSLLIRIAACSSPEVEQSRRTARTLVGLCL